MPLTEQARIERRRAYESKYYHNPKNRHKDQARGAVFDALKAGRLVRASQCEMCASPAEEAHHPDYSKPLEVQWLCVPCHRAVHRKTHCLRGHEYTEENTYRRKDGRRFCRACARDRVADLAERVRG